MWLLWDFRSRAQIQKLLLLFSGNSSLLFVVAMFLPHEYSACRRGFVHNTGLSLHKTVTSIDLTHTIFETDLRDALT